MEKFIQSGHINWQCSKAWCYYNRPEFQRNIFLVILFCFVLHFRCSFQTRDPVLQRNFPIQLPQLMQDKSLVSKRHLLWKRKQYNESEKTTENSVPVGTSLNPVEETKLARAYSALDGEALMEISSKDTCLKECGDGITHSASPYRRGSHEHDQSHSALSSGDCKGLFEEISGEEQTVLTVNEIEKDISA